MNQDEFNNAETESKLRMELVQQEMQRRKRPRISTSDIIKCAVEVYWCDPNDITENHIKFARRIEQLSLDQ